MSYPGSEGSNLEDAPFSFPERIAPEGDWLIVSLPKASAELTIEKIEGGSSITVTVEDGFYPDEPPVSYSSLLRYLNTDPPTGELEEDINNASIIPTFEL